MHSPIYTTQYQLGRVQSVPFFSLELYYIHKNCVEQRHLIAIHALVEIFMNYYPSGPRINSQIFYFHTKLCVITPCVPNYLLVFFFISQDLNYENFDQILKYIKFEKSAKKSHINNVALFNKDDFIPRHLFKDIYLILYHNHGVQLSKHDRSYRSQLIKLTLEKENNIF